MKYDHHQELARIDLSEPEPGSHVWIETRSFTAPSESAAKFALSQLKSAWRVIASLGRWCDQDLGDWPDDACLKPRLPAFLTRYFETIPQFEFANWTSDLHDRHWIWWSSSQEQQRIQIHLAIESSPHSTWTLNLVAEALSLKTLDESQGRRS